MSRRFGPDPHVVGCHLDGEITVGAAVHARAARERERGPGGTREGPTARHGRAYRPSGRSKRHALAVYRPQQRIGAIDRAAPAEPDTLPWPERGGYERSPAPSAESSGREMTGPSMAGFEREGRCSCSSSPAGTRPPHFPRTGDTGPRPGHPLLDDLRATVAAEPRSGSGPWTLSVRSTTRDPFAHRGPTAVIVTLTATGLVLTEGAGSNAVHARGRSIPRSRIRRGAKNHTTTG